MNVCSSLAAHQHSSRNPKNPRGRHNGKPILTSLQVAFGDLTHQLTTPETIQFPNEDDHGGVKPINRHDRTFRDNEYSHGDHAAPPRARGSDNHPLESPPLLPRRKREFFRPTWPQPKGRPPASRQEAQHRAHPHRRPGRRTGLPGFHAQDTEGHQGQRRRVPTCLRHHPHVLPVAVLPVDGNVRAQPQRLHQQRQLFEHGLAD